MLRLGLVCALLCGCLESPLVPCADKLCPEGALCVAGDCASPEAVTACAGAADRDPCTTSTIAHGYCIDGVCKQATCGNGIVEYPEACDDGNLVSGDGCSGDCDSLEVCGNDIVDAVVGEQCDSGPPGLSGDGCTSTCTVEVDDWAPLPPTDISPRTGVTLARDDYGLLVAFGGFRGVGIAPLGDTWTFDGLRWEQRVPATNPPARGNAAAAYDPIHHRLVMFGGVGSATTPLDETWSWDGVDWKLLQPAHRPPADAYPTMAYDESSAQLVLFDSGSNNSTWTTWFWNGDDWLLQADTTPTGPKTAALGYDIANQQLVLHRYDPYTSLHETWTWSGSAWVDAAPTSSPGADGPMVGYPGGGLLLYDATNAAVWQWSVTTWTALASAPHRSGAGLGTFGVGRSQHAVLVGGTDGNQIYGETYIETSFSSTTPWILYLPTLPDGRVGIGLAYDRDRGRVVALGDIGPICVPDTWELDSAGWIEVASGPCAVPGQSAIVYDSSRRQTLFYGNNLAGGATETWMYNGATSMWTQLAPAHTPTVTDNVVLIDDADRDVVMLFGSDAGAAEIWEWDGNDWTSIANSDPHPAVVATAAYDLARKRVVALEQLATGEVATWERSADWQLQATSRPPETNLALVYHETRGRTVWFDGIQTSEWDGTTWSPRLVHTLPTPRTGASLVFDAARNRLVLFGGTDGGILPQDTWTYGFSSAVAPPDRCIDVDTDGDGLVGCADPDCWARCTPFCPPGAACDPSAPRCGDGTCSVLEDYLLCPVDCPAP